MNLICTTLEESDIAMHLVVYTVHNERFALPSPHVIQVTSMEHFIEDSFCLSPFIGWVRHEHELKPVVDAGLLLFDKSMRQHKDSRILLINSGKIHLGLLAENIITRIGMPHHEQSVGEYPVREQFHHLIDKTIRIDDEVVHMIGSGRFQKAVQDSFFKIPS